MKPVTVPKHHTEVTVLTPVMPVLLLNCKRAALVNFVSSYMKSIMFPLANDPSITLLSSFWKETAAMFQLAINLTAKQFHPSAAAFISFTPWKRENKRNFFNNYPIPKDLKPFITFSLGGEKMSFSLFLNPCYICHDPASTTDQNHLISRDKVMKQSFKRHTLVKDAHCIKPVSSRTCEVYRG